MTRRSAPDRAALDDLLDGRSTGNGPLHSLLAAATAPGAPHELDGLYAAAAAFAAPPAAGRHPMPKRKTMIGTALANVLAAKILAASAAAAAVGGIAFAAATGHLSPTSSHPGTPASTHAQHSSASSDAPSGLDSTTPPVTRGSGSSSNHPAASPSPSLYGLCQAWTSGAGTAGHAASNPAFTTLVTAAGGAGSVDGFCANVLAAPKPSDSSADVPGSHAPPTAAPGNPTHPAGPPSSHGNSTHPTGAPSTHPTGAPSTHPGHTHS